MTSRLNPYLHFDGNARQALAFYREVFGGELTVNTYGEYGGEATDTDRIMHGQLESPSGYTLMAADTPPDQQLNPGDNITVCLSGDDGDELRGYWEMLSASGTVHVPLQLQMWGDEFGQCVDKFGIPWMVNITQAQA